MFLNGLKGDNEADRVNELLTVLGCIVVEKVEASVESDRINITKVIEDGYGYEKFNEGVSGFVRKWVFEVV